MVLEIKDKRGVGSAFVLGYYPKKDNTAYNMKKVFHDKEEEEQLRIAISLDSEILDFDSKVPSDFIYELEEFIERNSLGKITSRTSSGKERHYCCLRCLKAFAQRKALESGLNKAIINWLNDLFNCEMGHYGYYLDKENLVKI